MFTVFLVTIIFIVGMRTSALANNDGPEPSLVFLDIYLDTFDGNKLDEYVTGIEILEVKLQDVKPPGQVRDAFDDVLRARQERDTRINQARAFEADIIPRAEGDAERIKEGAEAFKQARITRAEGEADRFTSILQEYNKSQQVTRQRLYLEAMEEVLPGITKVILAPEAQSVLILGGDGSLTPVPFGPTP